MKSSKDMNMYSKYDQKVSVQESSADKMADNGCQITLTEPSSLNDNYKYQQSNSPGKSGKTSPDNEDIILILPDKEILRKKSAVVDNYDV